LIQGRNKRIFYKLCSSAWTSSVLVTDLGTAMIGAVIKTLPTCSKCVDLFVDR